MKGQGVVKHSSQGEKTYDGGYCFCIEFEYFLKYFTYVCLSALNPTSCAAQRHLYAVSSYSPHIHPITGVSHLTSSTLLLPSSVLVNNLATGQLGYYNCPLRSISLPTVSAAPHSEPSSALQPVGSLEVYSIIVAPLIKVLPWGSIGNSIMIHSLPGIHSPP